MLQHKWRTFEQGIDELVRLDIDLFEDLFEALAVFITDDEAEKGVEGHALQCRRCLFAGCCLRVAPESLSINRRATKPSGGQI